MKRYKRIKPHIYNKNAQIQSNGYQQYPNYRHCPTVSHSNKMLTSSLSTAQSHRSYHKGAGLVPAADTERKTAAYVERQKDI